MMERTAAVAAENKIAALLRTAPPVRTARNTPGATIPARVYSNRMRSLPTRSIQRASTAVDPRTTEPVAKQGPVRAEAIRRAALLRREIPAKRVAELRAALLLREREDLRPALRGAAQDSESMVARRADPVADPVRHPALNPGAAHLPDEKPAHPEEEGSPDQVQAAPPDRDPAPAALVRARDAGPTIREAEVFPRATRTKTFLEF
jgi:hypothetical protein